MCPCANCTSYRAAVEALGDKPLYRHVLEWKPILARGNGWSTWRFRVTHTCGYRKTTSWPSRNGQIHYCSKET